ncbi:hypothetical protein [Microvirga pudoricolor]|uniref:hypothetical protein n=1 Tax=Microvirga pudoricolor TaxID=2778729 RepID=UPI001950DB7A|nr:hypothetical protein [Microvirga pudoricolor]MBM6594101.1 hypothetical protein [Microvirga pudoricolor]
MTDDRKKTEATEDDISAPRLTPQGRTDPDGDGEDSTSPQGGAKTGQPSKAEG